MTSEKQTCQVLLFPLCDPRGALSEVLNDPPRPGTRLNALVLAWRMELSEQVGVADAAAAILTVAAARPRRQWSERQLRLVAELRRISDAKGGRPRHEWQRLLKKRGPAPKDKQRKTRTGRAFQDPDASKS
jgi:hypothetical protein